MFEEELTVFTESFNTHGPGTVGDDLEKGTCAPLSCALSFSPLFNCYTQNNIVWSQIMKLLESSESLSSFF